MKISNVCKGLFLGLALLLATSAFAASQGPLEVKENVSLNGKQLAAGNLPAQVGRRRSQRRGHDYQE